MSTASPGDRVYRELVENELSDQNARKVSFESRAVNVITSSGTLVTLLFGLAAISTRGAAFELAAAARDWLEIALGIFLLSALLALSVSLPWRYFRYEPIDEGDIEANLKDDRHREELDVHRSIALAQITALRAAKKANGRKGALLFAAIAAEGIAIFSVGIAVLQML